MGKKRKWVPPQGGEPRAKRPCAPEKRVRSKNPHLTAPPGGYDTCRPTWSLEHLDLDGPFSWRKMDGGFVPEVHEKLREFERRTWGDSLGKSKHWYHLIPVNDLTSEAKKRLRELELDDQDDVLSIHLRSRERVFAVRCESVAFLLWWDPDHQVCLSQKKHT